MLYDRCSFKIPDWIWMSRAAAAIGVVGVLGSNHEFVKSAQQKVPNAHLKDIKAETCRIGATFLDQRRSKVKLAVKLAAVVTITSLVAMSDLIYSRAFVAVQPQPKS